MAFEESSRPRGGTAAASERKGPDLARTGKGAAYEEGLPRPKAGTARFTGRSGAALAGLAPEAARKALWWEHHIVEVLTGLPPGVPAGTVPRPRYDPLRRSLAAREAAKAEELRTQEEGSVSPHTVHRKRRRYERLGVEGLVDCRQRPALSPTGRVDPRVVEVTREVLAAEEGKKPRSISRALEQIRQTVRERYGEDVVLPSRATFYRLLDKLCPASSALGARKQSGSERRLRFGESAAIVSTRLALSTRASLGEPVSITLTGVVDLADRVVLDAVLVPEGRSLDASVLLARTVVPEWMRPEWSAALETVYTRFPSWYLMAPEQRARLAARQPSVIPESIKVNGAQVHISRGFRSSCARFGIQLRPPADLPSMPSLRPDAVIAQAGEAFSEYARQRLHLPEETPSAGGSADPWPLYHLQLLLEEWVALARGPQQPGEGGVSGLVRGLRDPGRLYVELLPEVRRVVGVRGIRLRNHFYRVPEPDRETAPVECGRRLREVRFDPADITRVWVRDTARIRWLTALWNGTSRPLSTLRSGAR